MRFSDITRLVLGVFLCSVLSVSGTDRYLSALIGSDSNDGLTAVTPVRTLERVNQMLVAGDTCYIMGGADYSGPQNVDIAGGDWPFGTLAQPIYYRPYSGQSVKFKPLVTDGNLWGFFGTSGRHLKFMFYVDGQRLFHWDGVAHQADQPFIKPTYNGIGDGAQGLLFEGFNLYSNRTSHGILYNATAHGANQGNVFRYFEIYSCGDFRTSENPPHGCYVSDHGTGLTLEYGSIHNIVANQAFGYHVWGGDAVSNNIVNAVTFYSNSNAGIILGEPDYHSGGVGTNTIKNCTFWGNGTDILGDYHSSSWQIVNNSFVGPGNNTRVAINLASSGQAGGGLFRIINNVITGGYGIGLAVNSTAGGLNAGGLFPADQDVYASNNVIVGNAVNIANSIGTRFKDVNNVTGSQSAALTDLTSKPPNFRPLSTSILRNGGLTIGYNTTDLAGITRGDSVDENIYDVGALNALTDSTPTPTFTVTAVDPDASEIGLTTGTFRFQRTGTTVGALTVFYTVSGTATSGVDYTGLGSSVNFGDGVSVMDVTLTPLADGVNEGDEYARVSISGSVNYQVGLPSSADINLSDDPQVEPPPAPSGQRNRPPAGQSFIRPR